MGKSTIIDRVLYSLNIKTGGFKTFRHYTDGEHDGFIMEDLNDEKASSVHRQFIAQKGDKDCWRILPETFESFGVDVLKKSLALDIDLIIMDELGFFESNAVNFQKQVFQCLSASRPVLGVIKMRPTHFLDRIKVRDDVIVLPVTIKKMDMCRGKLHDIMMELFPRRQ